MFNASEGGCLISTQWPSAVIGQNSVKLHAAKVIGDYRDVLLGDGGPVAPPLAPLLVWSQPPCPGYIVAHSSRNNKLTFRTHIQQAQVFVVVNLTFITRFSSTSSTTSTSSASLHILPGST